MDKGNLTRAVYIDLRKACDTVDHGCLLTKLSYYGIENDELKSKTIYLTGYSTFNMMALTLRGRILLVEYHRAQY